MLKTKNLLKAITPLDAILTENIGGWGGYG
jgi:hypothetical protein